jgi:hypothetical protein
MNKTQKKVEKKGTQKTQHSKNEMTKKILSLKQTKKILNICASFYFSSFIISVN